MKEFMLKLEHIKLLSHASVDWLDCETGAPCIDCKRPYGNSDVAGDVAEILGIDIKKCPHCNEPLEEVDENQLMNWHHETETALQIILCTQSFVPGKYREVEYGVWKLVNESKEVL